MVFSQNVRASKTVVLLGLLVFALLAVRFSPNWLPFARVVEQARSSIKSVEEGAAIEKAIFSAYSARGYFVLQQAQDPGAEISDPDHKIVRWRLFFPLLGYVLHLPNGAVLGLAHLGCLILTLLLVAISLRHATTLRNPGREALSFALITGASAPFFTSMGLLGYYDSWLAIALLATGFARRNGIVLAACLLAPWIDERFVIGLPLALCVRRIVAGEAGGPRGAWFKQEALLPLLVVSLYSIVRLQLGGRGGSQTVEQYLHDFVYSQQISISQRLFGVWNGLRFGWVLVFVAIVGAWGLRKKGMGMEAGLLLAGVTLTGVIGMVTALDISRSMVLLFPIVPLGWMLATRLRGWSTFQVAPLLGISALLLPAWHCVGATSRPVDNVWSPAEAIVHAHNNLGVLFFNTPGRQAEALAHYVEAVRLKPDFADAHYNLGTLLAGIPGRQDEALRHYTEALRLKPDFAEAHLNLGTLLGNTPGRQNEAIVHYTQALRIKPDFADPHYNVATLLAKVPGRQNEALGHYATAVRLKPDFADAHFSLANLLASMPGREPEALLHYAEVLRIKPDSADAHNNIASLLTDIPGREGDALGHYAQAIRIKPDFAEAHYNLANLLARNVERRSDALFHYAESLRIRPDLGAAHYAMAQLLATTVGRQGEALAHFATAARLLPDAATVHFDFARQLEAVGGRAAEAEAHYLKALQLDPNLAGARQAVERLRRR